LVKKRAKLVLESMQEKQKALGGYRVLVFDRPVGGALGCPVYR
jgi:hypothetical protein